MPERNGSTFVLVADANDTLMHILAELPCRSSLNGPPLSLGDLVSMPYDSPSWQARKKDLAAQ